MAREVGIGFGTTGTQQTSSDVAKVKADIDALAAAIEALRKATASGLGIDTALASASAAADKIKANIGGVITEAGPEQFGRAEAAIKDFDGAAKEADKTLKKVSGSAKDTGIDVDRMAERIAIRLAVLAVFNAELKAAAIEVGKLGGQFEDFARGAGASEDTLVGITDIVSKLETGDFHGGLAEIFKQGFVAVEDFGVKVQFAAAQLGESLVPNAQRFVKTLAEIPLIDRFAGSLLKDLAEGAGNVTLEEVKLSRAVNEAGASFQRQYNRAKDQVDIQIKLTKAILDEGGATDAQRIGAEAALKGLEKQAKLYPDLIALLHNAERSVRANSSAQEELAKTMGTKTVQAIDDAIADFRLFVIGAGEAGVATQESSDVIVKKAKEIAKGIEQLPVAQRTAKEGILQELHATITAYDKFTSDYAKNNLKQEELAAKTAEKEAKLLDERRKNYETTFKAISQELSKLEADLVPKSASKDIAALSKELDGLRKEKLALDQQPGLGIDQENRRAELIGVISQKQAELTKALRESKVAVQDFGNASGPALAKVSESLTNNLVGTERFNKIFAEQSKGTQADIKSTIESFQRLAYNADLAGQSLTSNDFSQFRKNLADAFREGNGEAAKFASEIENTSGTVRGAFDELSATFDRVSKDQTVIAAGQAAVKDGFEKTKPAIDAETQAFDANSHAVEVNVAAKSKLPGNIGQSPATAGLPRFPGDSGGAPIAGPSPSSGGAAPFEGKLPGSPGLVAGGGAQGIGLPGGQEGPIRLKDALGTLIKDGLIPAQKAEEDLTAGSHALAGAHAVASELAAEFRDSEIAASVTLHNQKAELDTLAPSMKSAANAAHDFLEANTKTDEGVSRVSGSILIMNDGVHHLDEGVDQLSTSSEHVSSIFDTTVTPAVTAMGEALGGTTGKVDEYVVAQRNAINTSQDVTPTLDATAGSFLKVSGGASAAAEAFTEVHTVLDTKVNPVLRVTLDLSRTVVSEMGTLVELMTRLGS